MTLARLSLLLILILIGIFTTCLQANQNNGSVESSKNGYLSYYPQLDGNIYSFFNLND